MDLWPVLQLKSRRNFACFLNLLNLRLEWCQLANVTYKATLRKSLFWLWPPHNHSLTFLDGEIENSFCLEILSCMLVNMAFNDDKFILVFENQLEIREKSKFQRNQRCRNIWKNAFQKLRNDLMSAWPKASFEAPKMLRKSVEATFYV